MRKIVLGVALALGLFACGGKLPEAPTTPEVPAAEAPAAPANPCAAPNPCAAAPE